MPDDLDLDFLRAAGINLEAPPAPAAEPSAAEVLLGDVPIVESQVPTGRPPDPTYARTKLVEGARRREASTGDLDPEIRAVELADQAEAAVRVAQGGIPEQPTLMEQFALAFTPQALRDDARRLSETQQEQLAKGQMVRQARTMFPAILGPIDLASKAATGKELAEHFDPTGIEVESVPFFGTRLVQPTDRDLEGIQLENSTMALLRQIGTTAPAIIQEAVLGIPLAPDPEPDGDPDVGLLDYLDGAFQAVFGESAADVSDAVLGVSSAQRHVPVEGEGALASWTRRWLERVERGEGTDALLQAAAERRGGVFSQLPEDMLVEAANNPFTGVPIAGHVVGGEQDLASWLGWTLGFGLDIVVPWEGGLAKPATFVGKTAGRAGKLAQVMPAANMSEKLTNVLRATAMSDMDFGDFLGVKAAEGLRTGELTLETLPRPIRQAMDEVAREEFGLTLDEVVRREQGQARYVDPEIGQVAPDFNPRDQLLAPGVERPVLEELPDIRAAAHRIEGRAPVEGLEELSVKLEGPDVDLDERLFTLRSPLDDVVITGTLREVTEVMMKRRVAGDQVWLLKAAKRAEGGLPERIIYDRPSVTWSKAGKLRPGARASKAEGTFVVTRVKADARADSATLAPRPRGIMKVDGQPVEPGRVIQGLIDGMSGAPVRRLRPIGEGETLGELAQEGARLWSRKTLGSHLLQPLPNGALVTRGERKLITQTTVEAQKRLGLEGLAGQILSDEQLSRVMRVAHELDLTLTKDMLTEANQLTPVGHRAIQNALLERVGGVAANARYRITGIPGVGDKIVTALAKVSRQQAGKVASWWKRVGIKTVGAFFEAPLAGLPKQTQDVLRELEVLLKSNGTDLMHEIREELRVAGNAWDQHAVALAVHKLVRGYMPSTLPEIELAAEIRLGLKAGRYATDEALLELRDRVAAEARRAGTKPMAWMTSRHPEVVASGLYEWAQRGVNNRAAMARKYLEAAARGLDGAVTNETLEQVLDRLDQRDLLDLYDAVFVQEGLDDQIRRTNELLGRAGVKAANPDEAMTAFALHLRAEDRWKQAIGRLLDEGIALPEHDPRVSLLHDILHGIEVGRAPGGQRVGKYPAAARSWAEIQLTRWGLLDGGAGTQLETTAGVTLPKFLAQDLERMKRQGIVGTNGLFGAGATKTWPWFYRMFKKGVTHGLLLPNPSYFMGQMLSVLPTLWTTRGLADAASTPFTLTRNAPLLSYLFQSTARGHLRHAPVVGVGQVLRTTDGRVYTTDDLLDLVHRGGLDESSVRVENAEQLVDYVRRESRTTSMNPFRILYSQLGEMQKSLEDAASFFDQAARYNVLIEDLRRGLPEETAIRNARVAVLDFDDLTPTEKKWGRLMFTFYAFARKNVDAYTRSLFEAPERFFAQMRAVDANHNAFFTSEESRTWDSQQMGRLTLYRVDDITRPGGGVDWRYAGYAVQSTPLGPVEFLNSLQLFLAPVRAAVGGLDLEERGDDPVAMMAESVLNSEGLSEDLLGQANPLVGTALLWAAGQTTRGYDIERSPHANRILEYLAAGPWDRFVMNALDAQPVPIREWEDPLLASPSASAVLGQPGYWTVGGHDDINLDEVVLRRKAWHTINLWAGRSIQTAGNVAIMASGEGVPPDMTIGQWSALQGLGLRRQLIDSPILARDRQLRELESAIRDANETIQSQLSDVDRVR